MVRKPSCCAQPPAAGGKGGFVLSTLRIDPSFESSHNASQIGSCTPDGNGCQSNGQKSRIQAIARKTSMWLRMCSGSGVIECVIN